MQDIIIGRQNNGSVALGVLLIILGLIAVMSPLFAALVLIRVVGWLLVFAAVEQVIHAFRSSGEGGVFIKVLLAVLYGAAGFVVLSRPVNGAVAATAVIGVLLVVDGIMEIALGAIVRRVSARSGWLFAGGILSLLLGAIILYRLPWSMAAIGLLVGIRLIFKGIEQIAHSSSGKSAPTIVRRAA